jgi:hypothetical protein
VEVLRKKDGLLLPAGDHCGDPALGLIASDESWFISAGEGLQCYSIREGLFTFFRRGHPPIAADSLEHCWWVHGARLEALHSVRILIDPWSGFSSVWRLDLNNFDLTKLADGPYLADTPYRDLVDF